MRSSGSVLCRSRRISDGKRASVEECPDSRLLSPEKRRRNVGYLGKRQLKFDASSMFPAPS
jgi:hypothetical protein